jgi:Rap1a immunity proteins
MHLRDKRSGRQLRRPAVIIALGWESKWLFTSSIAWGLEREILSMRATQIVLLAIIVWLLPGISQAEIRNFDGNTLSNLCKTNANRDTPSELAMQAGACLGYLSSIIDIQTTGGAVIGRRACIPANADMNQIVDLFKNYVREHPERRHLLAANLAAEAFALAFPCRP